MNTPKLPLSPEDALAELFVDVQQQGLLTDGKSFVDARPVHSYAQALAQYRQRKHQDGFSLPAFLAEAFVLPSPVATGFTSRIDAGICAHIDRLWDQLTRTPEDDESGSLIPLPKPYVVPGGRFREVYYWDSYFTMLGLKASGRWDLITHMLDNFTHLIATLGHIPNGNRSYYASRSQPPFYGLMLRLLAEHRGDTLLRSHLPWLEAEYAYWMQGEDQLHGERSARQRVLQLGPWRLNRFWDDKTSPRPESYREDRAIAEQTDRPASTVYRHIRAAAESGWDFSSRWFADPTQMASIRTTDIVPIDLNCVLLLNEQLLANIYSLQQQQAQAARMRARAQQRATAITELFWNESKQCFYDLEFNSGQHTSIRSLAAMYPLYAKVASKAQAKAMARNIERDFLCPGGLRTTTHHSGQQWDSPNGWAPLHWIAIEGLRHYGYTELADTVRRRWVQLNLDVFNRSGKLLEKYDVCNPNALGGGGEYPVQDGFGWTNGVLRALLAPD